MLPFQVEEIVEGKIDCDLFITDTIRLEDINEAIAQMKAGKGCVGRRCVIPTLQDRLP